MKKIWTAINFIVLFAMGNLSSALFNDEGKPSEELKCLLNIFEVPHDGSLDSIVSATQKRWMQTGKERWEYEERFTNKREAAFDCFRQIGCVDTVKPQKTEYRAAVVLGALTKRMELRIKTLIDTWNDGVRFDKVYLLGGVRPLDPKVEPTLPNIHNEADMFGHLYVTMREQMPEELAALPFEVLTTRMQQNENGKSRRPNTLDTIRSWLADAPGAGDYLFISNQPFVGYQDSVVHSILPSDMTVETIGVQADELPLSVHLDNLARWLYQEKARRSQQ